MPKLRKSIGTPLLGGGSRWALASAEAMTDEEDARLHAAALADPDNPPLTEEQMSRMVPAHLVKNRGGRPRIPRRKLQITARLDPDVLDFLRSGGPGWQTRMNDILRRAMKRAEPAVRLLLLPDGRC